MEERQSKKRHCDTKNFIRLFNSQAHQQQKCQNYSRCLVITERIYREQFMSYYLVPITRSMAFSITYFLPVFPLKSPHLYHPTAQTILQNLCIIGIWKKVPYIPESNPHTFYSFRGLKNQMRIRIACGLDSRSWAGFWKNDRAAVRVVRTIQYNYLYFIYYLL